MAKKETVLTSEGLKKLEQELEDLKIIKRKEISDQLKVAISFGDLSENSEYDEAKNAQAMNEARILELEAMLKNVRVVDAAMQIRVRDVEFDEEETFFIVGSTEVDPLANKISDESPIGKALIGAKVGDIVRIKDGAFMGYEGSVQAIDETRGRLTVVISIFGRSTPVDLEFWQVEQAV